MVNDDVIQWRVERGEWRVESGEWLLSVVSDKW